MIEEAPETEYLVVANAYPSDRALYRNGFIHRRIKGYEQHQLSVQVYYMHPPASKSYAYEYDGVHVTVGNSENFKEFLKVRRFKKILIHFASPDMVFPILDVTPSTPIIVWIHGFEAEAWHRRWFNFIDSSEQIRAAVAKKATYYDRQLEFMRWLYTTHELSVQTVHVSEWFQKHIVEPDAGVETQNATVIPNFIDDELFSYVPKNADQRLKILSIRPYASMKYANDLTVRAIIELSKRPFFEKLQFELHGEGALFDRILAPVQKFDNVKISKGFLSQDQISAKHKEFGIFLCPTRFDSQGVSMCEAMSSGLVPVTTDSSAISEFVGHQISGTLSAPEDAIGLADWIQRMYFNPELFERLSAGAATDIREKCSIEGAVARELALMLAEDTE